jgi:HEAT repeat protein
MERGSLTKRLLSALNVQPGEGARVAWMMLYSVAAIGGFLTIGLAAASALFLSELPATATPFVFISSGASSVIVFLLYSLAMSRLPQDGLVLVSDVLLLAIALILRLLLGTRYGQSFPVLLTLFLFVDAGATLVITQFWVRAAQIFNPREAKRLFGLISAAGTASAILASLGLRSWVAVVGVENLLLVVAAALVVCILCARATRMPAHGARAVPQPIKADRPSLLKDLGAILRMPLLLVIGGLTILTALLINTGAYQYFLALQALYAGRSQEMVKFLGAFGVVTGVIALFVQLYLSSRLLRRLGVFGVLFFFPLAMAAGAGLGLATGGALLAMAVVRAADPMFRQTINQSAMTVLYLPVPEGLRQRAKTILEIGYALSFGLLGVLFLVSQRIPRWSYVTWSLPVLGFVVLWLLLLRWGRPQYQRALADNLQKRRLDFANAIIDISDQTTVQVLAAALRSPDELLVLHTLDLITHAPSVDWAPRIAPLLGHPSPAIRTLALRHLGQPGTSKELAEAVAALLQAPESEVRAAAVSAVSAIGGPPAPDRVAAFLDDPSPAVRGAALVALSRTGGPKWEKTAEAKLKTSAASDDQTVRVSAIRAAGALRSRELLPQLIAGLGHRPVAAEAADALSLYGPGIENDLGAALDDATLAPAVRSRIPAVLCRLKTQVAAELLTAHIREPDPAVRSALPIVGEGVAPGTIGRDMRLLQPVCLARRPA